MTKVSTWTLSSPFLVVITVPEGTSLRKVDLAVELQILSFYQQQQDPDAALGATRA